MTMQLFWSRDFRWWRLTVLFAMVLPCVAVLFASDPAQSKIFPPCPFRSLTGFDCPGCGTLRGLHQLLHGNFVAAVDLNVMIVMMVPYFGVWISAMLAADFTGRNAMPIAVSAKLVWVLLLGIIIFWIVRNIPSYPFTVLAS